jgi:signal recognition particle subunit SRP54
MRAVTGKPIKLIGAGEKMDALDDFHPQRIANRILGMGDIVALVEKAAENIDAEKAMRIADKMRKGKFDLQDMADQLAQVETMGGLGGIMNLLPGMGKIKEQMAAAKIDNSMIKRQRAIILSMTTEERRNPDVLKASRKKRIAAGSGTKVEEVNRLLKQHRSTADMMKSMGGGAKRGPMAQMAQAFGLGGGMPQPSPEDIAELQKKFGGGAGMGLGIPSAPPSVAAPPKPAALPGLPGKLPGLPSGLPGLGGGKPSGLPGLGGFNPFGKKK